MYDLIVVGGGLSGLTAAYRAQQRGWRTLLLEAKEHTGGSLESRWEGDTLLELGAESMVLAKPWGKELCEELGIELVRPQPAFQKTLICRGGRLLPIPEGLRLLAPSQWLPFLRSPAVSWRGKLRMAGDFFLAPKMDGQDESLASFVRRRLGQEALERLAQPLVAGIYTADPETLSMAACLPQFLEYERRYGSVCKGLWHSPEARASSGPRYQLFCAPKGGFGQLVGALHQKLAEVRTGHSVEQIRPLPEGGWRVDAWTSRRLVVALPTYVTAPLVREWAPEVAQELDQQKYLSSATVNLSYPLLPLDMVTRAYGFVVPAVEKRDILACTFSHRKYPGRTSGDVALLRAYVGGAGRPEAVEWSDEEMVERSHNELSRLLGFAVRPFHSAVTRYRRAMPLYEVGHLLRQERLAKGLSAFPNLGLVGNAYKGVGIPDCIRLANEVISGLA